MADKDWLLNPHAIKAAKACILIVQGELDVKLKLSHPNFIEMLKDYVELTDSEELEDAYHRLIDFAGASAHHFKAYREPKKTVVSNKDSSTKHPTTGENIQFINGVEHISLKGKFYKRFDNGKEFQGLYRGQPRYS